MASSSTVSVDAKVPLLASASGTSGSSGVSHALWRPQMQTFLMRQGIEERDYAEEIPQWAALSKLAGESARVDRENAIAVILGQAKPVKQEALSVEEAAARKQVATMIGLSRKAYGYLYSALPAELRPLVADVPQGYAYGIWSFLEKKFRNTEQDTIMSLWQRLTLVQQEPDETHDVYKARVDSVLELLSNAKQTVPAGLYASLMLWRLQPRYTTAVLTLKTSDRLKDPSAIDWPYIAQFMAEYERSQLGLGDTDSSGASDRVMAAFRGKPGAASSSSQSSGGGGRDRPRDTSHVECYNCHKTGHFARKCPLPDSRKEGQGKKKKPREGGQLQEMPSSSVASPPSSTLDGSGTPRTGASFLVRSLNRFGALSDDEESDDDEDADSSRSASPQAAPARTFLSRVLAGISPSKEEKPPQPRKTEAKKEKPTPTVAQSVKAAPTKSSSSRESSRRPAVSPAHTPKSLDVALRTTSRAIDTGATVHITGTRENLVNVRPCMPMPLLMADNTVVSAVYKGDMPMRLQVAGKETKATVLIRGVYYHERIDANLLSWGLMRVDGWQMHSTPEGTHLLTPRGVRINASTRGRLTILEDAGPEKVYAARLGRVVCQSAEDLLALHRRVGHVSWDRLIKMCKANTTAGLASIDGMSVEELKKAETAVKECAACIAGKQHRNALGHRGLDKGTEAGEVLHMDTFYVMMRNPQTNQKYREYCLVATCGFTKVRWVAKTTSLRDLQTEAIDIIRSSTTAAKRQPRLIVSDLGSEFNNGKVDEYCRSHGIHLQMTPARAKEMNGVAEKSVDTVKNHARTMMRACGISDQEGWWRAVAHHAFLWNRTHIPKTTGKTPYEAMTGRQPSIMNVGVFGCDAFVHQDRSQRDTTFSPKAEPGVYLGHDAARNCSVVRMLNSGKTAYVKDVIFREGSFEHLRTGPTKGAAVVDLSDLMGSGGSRADGASNTVEDEDDPDAPAAKQLRFEVKNITEQRTGANGKKEFLVKWVGYKVPTWEPADTIREDAPEAVQEFEEFLTQRSAARVTRSRSGAAAAAAASSAASSSSSSSISTSSSQRREHESDDDDEDSEFSDMQAARIAAARCL
jgi:transposase InsO family protein